MKKNSTFNQKYTGFDGKENLYDLVVPENFNNSLLIFAHGYMGYKDWGAWNLMQDYFTEKGYAFLKFNFSHNGTTLEIPIDFPDLKSFSENNYSKEVYDLGQIIKLAEEKFLILPEITLIGHSRGGGITLLNAGNNNVKAVICLASISSIEKRFSDEEMLEKWKNEGVRYVKNQRTLQEMPHSYSQVIDFEKNKDSLSIQKSCENLSKPILIIHGENDSSVPLSEGEDLAKWTQSHLIRIPGADHVFGAKQPWDSAQLPSKLKEVCEIITSFLKQLWIH